MNCAFWRQCQRILNRLEEEIGININVSDFEEPCASENVALRQLVADAIGNKNEARSQESSWKTFCRQ